MSSMIPVRYVGALHDCSGYASAARQYVNALIDHPQIDLTLDLASFEKQKTHHGPIMDKMESLIHRPLVPKINIVHLTPENYSVYKKPGCYNIGYTVWETELLPDFWIELCNSMDEIWVPSQWNVKVFQESGITVPVYCIPHILPLPDLQQAQLNNLPVADDTYKFYSIFQWIERKNPSALLRAYLTEFTNADNVCLILKTYRVDFSHEEKNCIKSEIQAIKRGLNLDQYPPIAFFGDLMTAAHVAGLHQQCDCFVMPQRGEGFGIPFAEAMSYGNPTIATNYSGNLEFMTPENSFLVDYMRTPVYRMLFQNYNARMVWAEPSIMDLRNKMRYVYENQQEGRRIGQLGKDTIASKLNQQVIGQKIVDRLRTICDQKGLA